MRVLTCLLLVILYGCREAGTEGETSGGVPKVEQDPETEVAVAVRAAMDGEDYEAAERMLSELIEDKPDDFDAISGRVAVRVLQGDKDGAREDFEAAVRMDPERGKELRFVIADRAMWRARGFDMEKRYAEALEIYDILLELFPNSGMVLHDRGSVKTSMGDYAGAIEDLTLAIAFDEGNNAAGDSYVLRARAKRAAGDEAGAAEDEAKAEAIYEEFGK